MSTYFRNDKPKKPEIPDIDIEPPKKFPYVPGQRPIDLPYERRIEIGPQPTSPTTKQPDKKGTLLDKILWDILMKLDSTTYIPQPKSSIKTQWCPEILL